MTFSLQNVQIETTSVCNQRCSFCPVSVKKRSKSTLNLEQLKRILDQLTNQPVNTIYLNGFNEPTYDKEIIQKIALIYEYGYSVSFLSNGSGLTPELVEQLFSLGVLSYCINLSTIVPNQYKETRGNNDIVKVLPNVEHLLERSIQEDANVTILIVGNLDDTHAGNIQKIHQHYNKYINDKNTISICPAVDYAANLTEIRGDSFYHKTLKGCVNNRHKKWLHISASGNLILCCHDYEEKYAFSHIGNETLENAFSNTTYKQFSRWIEGEEKAPENFICRYCLFALSEDDFMKRVEERFCSNCVLPEYLKNDLDACSYCEVKKQ